MSLWSQPLYNQDVSFTPLFRLLDDFDRYSNRTGSHLHHAGQKFNPKFDVIETPDAFELHAELSGVEKKDVQIEFTDQQTISVRGRVERSYRAGTPPASTSEAIEGSAKPALAIDHHATVEDEAEASTAQPTPATTVAEPSTEVAPTEKKEAAKKQGPKHHYWVSERSVGSFHRTFTFPSNVDQEAVKATLDNGVLTVVVPKAKKVQTRSIAIA